MRKTGKKMLASLISAVMVSSVMPFGAYAVDGKNDYRGTIRVEGINECFLSGNYHFVEDEEITVSYVIDKCCEAVDTLQVTGLSSGYITDVNGDKAGTFGGWDGWLYRVNGKEASVSMDDYILTDGDEIVLFYGDPYGVGMQYPTYEYDVKTDVFTFTSLDTTWNDSGEPVVTENPVQNMDVELGYDGYTMCFTTDENGQFTADLGIVGDVSVKWYKYDAKGCPLVLRSSPDEMCSYGYMPGDFNGDHIVNPVDATAVLNEYTLIAAGRAGMHTTKQVLTADVDKNGVINPVDATLILRYYTTNASGSSVTFAELMK